MPSDPFPMFKHCQVVHVASDEPIGGQGQPPKVTSCDANQDLPTLAP